MNKARPQDDGPYYLVVENEHGSDKALIKVLVTDPTSMDFRALLKHREYEQWGQDKSEMEDADLKPPEQPGRRMSIRPDRKQDHWVKELDDVRVQQTVHKQAVFTCIFSTGKAKIRWFKNKQELFTVSFLLFLSVFLSCSKLFFRV